MIFDIGIHELRLCARVQAMGMFCAVDECDCHCHNIIYPFKYVIEKLLNIDSTVPLYNGATFYKKKRKPSEDDMDFYDGGNGSDEPVVP